MQLKIILKCDVCGMEGSEGTCWTQPNWRENWNGGMMTIVPDGVNGVVKFEHVCPPCRAQIHAIFLEKINHLRKTFAPVDPPTPIKEN